MLSEVPSHEPTMGVCAFEIFCDPGSWQTISRDFRRNFPAVCCMSPAQTVFRLFGNSRIQFFCFKKTSAPDNSECLEKNNRHNRHTCMSNVSIMSKLEKSLVKYIKKI